MKRIVLIFIATACTALGLYAQPAPTYTLKSCLEQGIAEQLLPAHCPQ